MYIYGLFDESGELRYIGQTIGTLEGRLKNHLWPSSLKNRRDHRANWIRSMLRNGNKPTISKIQELYRREDLNAAEIYWISYFKSVGCRLTNMTEGGENPPKASPETIEKIRLKKIGRKQSLEAIEKARLARIGRKNSKEALERMKQAGIKAHGKPVTDSTGTIYPSIQAAADYYNVSKAAIFASIKRPGNIRGLRYYSPNLEGKEI